MHAILAARTDFSLGESILNAEKLVDIAKEQGAKAIAITDTMSITGMIDFTNRAKKAEVKPIIGVRLRLSEDPTWRPAKGQKKKHMPPEHFLTAYVLTETGMKAIYRLLTKANSGDTEDAAGNKVPGRFYYTAKLGYDDLWEELEKLGAGHLAFHLGDTHGVIMRADAEQILERLVDCLHPDYVFAPLIPIDTPYFGTVNKRSLDLIARFKARPLVVRPAYYEADQADAHEVMTAIANNNKVTDGWHKSTFNRDFHVLKAADLGAEVVKAAKHVALRGVVGAGAHFKQGLANTDWLVDAVEYTWSKAPVSLPVMAEDEFASLVAECKAGWKVRFSQESFGHKPTQQELIDVYKPRLAYELEVLKKLSFAGYFLLVQDVVQFSKQSGILVGPGRGSVGGSLVAYLMGITDCDPIRFGLLFERFINPERLDLPDADLDFMSTRRHEVVEYLIKKYGEKRVAGVSNFGTLAAASSIRDVGRTFQIPEKEYSISKLVPKKHGANVPLPECRMEVAEIDEFAAKYPAHWDIMERIEGTIRNMSQHAAGIVVGGVDLEERAVIEKRKGDSAVVCWDKRIVEDQGLVKMDILGLSTLDLIALVLRYIFERHQKKINLMKVPLDDPAVLKNFAAGLTTGVFQFESPGMRKLLRELGADGCITFDDITAATALYRPGPMESGMMDSYYLRKQGNETVDYDHPLMEDVLRETYGVIVYQEQVMKISQVIAGYTGAQADKLRKIMGKKLPEEMKKERSNFVDGCVKTIACTDEWAGALFDKIEGFAGYGFNKSHSVEYSLISWQSMWLKTHYPVEFFAAALTLMDEDKLPAILRDAARFGIDVNMPDINISTERFEIVTDVRLVMPFQRIKGISSNTTNAILEARKAVDPTTKKPLGLFKDKADFLERVNKTKCNKKHQENLDLVGAFSRIEPGQLGPNDPARIKDQLELLPGLVTATVPVARSMENDKATKDAIAEVIDDYKADLSEDGIMVHPHFGKQAQFMIITDAPNNPEEQEGMMSIGKASAPVIDALMSHQLDRKMIYWTALLKRPKSGKQVSPEEIRMYWPYLEREIDILKPPIIVLLGTAAVRHFMPDFKGKTSDVAGKVVYHKDLDANLVIGFNPGEIYYAPEKQDLMEEVFASVVDLLD
ncbi:DNA polymerase-3 subunit alpha [Rhizobium azibense]|nr:DNA polymerase-3 subunit alpha [Rhizobium azibense]